MKKENYSSIDILKFICSLLVVILHLVTYAFADMASDSAPPTGKNSPFLFFLPIAFTILRVAVPMFFVSSGFLLFKKIKENPDNSWELVKNYCKRIMKLWLFWFIVSLPIMIDKHFIATTGNFGIKLLNFSVRVVFYGGFDGAWYLFATVLSVLFVYWLSRKLSNCYVFLILFILYALASLSGTYFHLFDGTFLGQVFKFLNDHVALYRTFFNGSIFVFIGKLFAEKDKLVNGKLNIALLILLPIAMYGELLITNYFGLNFTTECFFTLIPFSIVLFQAIINTKLKPRNIYKTLRTSSTFIYLFHFIFLYVLYRFASAFNWDIFYGNIFVTIGVYITIIVVSILLSIAIKKLSKKIKILKYAF